MKIASQNRKTSVLVASADLIRNRNAGRRLHPYEAKSIPHLSLIGESAVERTKNQTQIGGMNL